jgi:hypothetical protein
MSRSGTTVPLLNQRPVVGGDQIPAKGYWYQHFDAIKYYTQGVQSMTFFLFILVVTSGGFSANYALLEQSNIYNQLHAVPYAGTIGVPPSQYMSMDWIMTAKRVLGSVGNSFVSSAVSRDMCVVSKEDTCNPEWWQTVAGCNISSATQLRLPAHVAEVQEYFYTSKRMKYRHLQPLFTCMTEKIGDVALYLNNEHSYSIGSTHNVNILVAGVFFILAIILTSMLLAMIFTNPDIVTEYQRRVVLTVLVIFYIMLVYSLASTASVDATRDQHRPIGLASHTYSSIFLLFSLLVFNQSGTLKDHTEEFNRMQNNNTDDDEVAPEDTEIPIGHPAAPGEDASDDLYGKSVELNAKSAYGMQTLNVRRFVQEPTHYDTRIKQVFIAPTRYSEDGEVIGSPPQSDVSVDVCALISIPVHSKFVYGQLLTLPLIMLALYMHGKNYGLDTYSQIIFIATAIIAMVDVFLYRMWWAFQIHKGVTFYLKDDSGEYKAMEVLTFLCVLYQISIYTFLLTSEFFSKSYVWFFCVYIIVTALAKIVGVVAIRQAKNPNKGKENTGFPSQTFDAMTGILQKGDFYMFVLYVLSVSIILWVYVIGEQLHLDSEWINKTPMVQRWGAGWETYNAMSM